MELDRIEMVPGVSVLAPAYAFKQGPAESPQDTTPCRSLGPQKDPNAAKVACGWYGPTSRSLSLYWYEDILPGCLSDEQRLSARREVFQLNEDAFGVPTRLEGRWLGWQSSPGESGSRIVNRHIALGRNVVFLKAVALEDDPFPEASLFFDSLRVDCAGGTAGPDCDRSRSECPEVPRPADATQPSR